jgi:hypothetical protein
MVQEWQKSETHFHNGKQAKPDHESRPEHFTSRAKKIWVFGAEKILPMTVPWDVSGLSFRVGPELGRAARVF